MQVLPRLFKLLPWVDLDTFYAKVKFGDIGFCMGRSENYLFFGNFCSLWSQSCLKHSTQWVNEVEWVSVVKVILWPWSKVTQISKLNVWILACILRWAIQGLLGLLFRNIYWMHCFLLFLFLSLVGVINDCGRSWPSLYIFFGWDKSIFVELLYSYFSFSKVIFLFIWTRACIC